MSNRRNVGDIVVVRNDETEFLGRIDALDADRGDKCHQCSIGSNRDHNCKVWPNVAVYNTEYIPTGEWAFHISECKMFDLVSTQIHRSGCFNVVDIETINTKSTLDSYLMWLRKAKKTYSEGLELAKQFALDSGGEIITTNDDVTIIKALGEVAHCFQPYPDIDRFYFET